MIRQIAYPGENKPPKIQSRLLESYSFIVTDPSIHNGWPHIKGTKILAFDIFRSVIEGHSLQSILFNLKKIGVKATQEQLSESFNFTLHWLSTLYLNEKKTFQKTR